MVTLFLMLNDIRSFRKNMYETIEESNTKLCNEINKIVKDTNVKEKMSYAKITANNVIMPDVSENILLIVKPREKQNFAKTKGGVRSRP